MLRPGLLIIIEWIVFAASWLLAAGWSSAVEKRVGWRREIAYRTVQIAGAVVRHGVMFEISPDAFDGVHIRRVSGQVVDHDLTALGFHMCPHEFRAMRLQAIPYDQQPLADRGLQGFEELDDLRTLDRAGEHSEVEAPVAQARDHRIVTYPHRPPTPSTAREPRPLHRVPVAHSHARCLCPVSP